MAPAGHGIPQELHFLHIGKTGGTALKHAIGSAQAATSENKARRPYFVHLHRHAIGLRDIPAGERFFFFVRDPVDRFVSGFYSRLREGRPRYTARWSEQERKAFKRFPTPSRLASALSATNDQERTSAEIAMKNIAHVRDSYWRWFESEDYFLSRLEDVFFIGFQARLSQDFEILKSRLRLPRELMLPTDEVQSHANPRHLDRTLRNAAATNLRTWYEKDYLFLRLCDRIIHEHPRIRVKRFPVVFGLRQMLSSWRLGKSRRN